MSCRVVTIRYLEEVDLAQRGDDLFHYSSRRFLENLPDHRCKGIKWPRCLIFKAAYFELVQDLLQPRALDPMITPSSGYSHGCLLHTSTVYVNELSTEQIITIKSPSAVPLKLSRRNFKVAMHSYVYRKSWQDELIEFLIWKHSMDA